MSNARDRAGARNRAGGIRGPQSALTNFLASNNISALEIRRNYQQRIQDAENQEAELRRASGILDDNGEEEEDEADKDGTAAPEEDGANNGNEAEDAAENVVDSSALVKKRKRQQSAAIEKIKKQKQTDKRAKQGVASDDDNDLGWGYTKQKPLPGQLEYCETCEKRFTVTPYTKEGPNGGLLCAKCSKMQDADKKKAEQNKKSRVARENRRKMQSNILDGERPVGVKSLSDMCIETVADNIDDVEAFGSLPPKLMDRLGMILSKRRLLTSKTLNLFIGPEYDRISLYDCANLSTDDFIRIFQLSPKIKHVNLELCGQVKDNVIDFVVEREVPIEVLRLEAPNLVTDAKWQEYFTKRGHLLRELKLCILDNALGDETVQCIVDHCPDLEYLKFKRCTKMTGASIRIIAGLRKLKHLHLRIAAPIRVQDVVHLIEQVGANLQSLTLDAMHFDCHDEENAETEQAPDQNAETNGNAHQVTPADDEASPPPANTLIPYPCLPGHPSTPGCVLYTRPESPADAILSAIHRCCRRLVKLRITESGEFTDESLAELFRDWANPPLVSINFTKIRSLDEAQPPTEFIEEGQDADGFTREGYWPQDLPYSVLWGVGDRAFEAMMAHSWKRLETLKLRSCRHISLQTLLNVFVDGEDKTGNQIGGVLNGPNVRNGPLISYMSHALGPGRYPMLKDVTLSFVAKVDTAVVAGVFASSPRLERLVVFGCFGVHGAIVPPGVALIGVPFAGDHIVKQG